MAVLCDGVPVGVLGRTGSPRSTSPTSALATAYDKVATVRDLKGAGRGLTVLGGGINDAPTLAPPWGVEQTGLFG